MEKWKNRIFEKCCINPQIIVLNDKNIDLVKNILNIDYNIDFKKYAWWDIFRLKHNLILLDKLKQPIINIDLDIIIEKNIEDIINLPYDIIISKEIGEDKSYPLEFSKILGLGLCTGFYCIKPRSKVILDKIYLEMIKGENYSDQYNIMKYICENEKLIKKENIILDTNIYTNYIIEIENITICVLDFDIITRDPIVSNNQYGNHINIDNVGGSENFLKYFDNNLEYLPLTCRCGKKTFK
jgi:hypothetical protein